MVTKINRMKNTLALHNREGKKRESEKQEKYISDFCDVTFVTSAFLSPHRKNSSTNPRFETGSGEEKEKLSSRKTMR